MWEVRSCDLQAREDERYIFLCTIYLGVCYAEGLVYRAVSLVPEKIEELKSPLAHVQDAVQQVIPRIQLRLLWLFGDQFHSHQCLT